MSEVTDQYYESFRGTAQRLTQRYARDKWKEGKAWKAWLLENYHVEGQVTLHKWNKTDTDAVVDCYLEDGADILFYGPWVECENLMLKLIAKGEQE